MKTKLIIMPMPVTPLSILGYLMYEKMGFIGPDTCIRLAKSHVSKVAPARISLGDNYVLNFTDTFLIKEELMKIAKEHNLSRLFNWINYGENFFSEWLYEVSQHESINLIINQCKKMLSKYLNGIADPWKEKVSLPFTTFVDFSQIKECKKEILSLMLPKYKEDSIHKRESDVIGEFEVKLDQTSILKLIGKKISLVIGGPPSSGKSTLAVSLEWEMNEILRSLAPNSIFKNLDLIVRAIDLDLGTQTLEAIHNGTANDRLALQKLKRIWTMDLARESLETFLQNKRSGTILIGDLPGLATDFSLIIASGADVAITITRDWDVLVEWKKLFREIKVPWVAKVRSRQLSESGFQSAVTTYNANELLSGRIVGLDRNKRSNDPFIKWLAIYLLFDVLPHMVDDHVI